MTTDALHDIPDTVEVHGDKSEGGKLSIFLGILRRYFPLDRLMGIIGLLGSEISRLYVCLCRLNLLNLLETWSRASLSRDVDIRYWNYLDRPDYFVRCVSYSG